MAQQLIYIEEISSSSIFSLVKYCIIHRLTYSSWPLIIYIDATSVWGYLSKGLSQIGCPVKKLHFSLREIKDLSGELLRIRIHRKDLFEVKKRIENSPLIKEVSHRLDEFEKLYLIKGMVDYPITESNSASRILFLIGLIEWHTKIQSVHDAFFLVRKRPWPEIYLDYAKKRGIELVYYRTPLSFKHKDRFSNIFNFLPPLYVFLRAMKSIKSINFSAPKIFSNPKVFIEGRGEVNFKNDGQHSDFYWMKPGKISPNYLVYTPADDLEKSILIANYVNLASYDINQIFAAIVSFKKFYLHFFSWSWSLEKRLVARMIRAYLSAYWYWRGLFLSNNIKVFLTWYRYENQHIAITSAIRSVGGVSVYLPVAFDGWENIEGLTRTDVAFCYSDFGSNIEDRCFSHSEYRIIVGYPRDYAVDFLRPLATDVRQRLIQNGAKKIIFVIDENSAADDRWHTGHELQRENYRYALEALLENEWLGVIFKPKVARTLYERLGPVSELLDLAKSTGRCFIYDETSRDLTTASPLLAGLSADLCIHGHLSSGTAALECALAGLPTLLVDREGVPNSKLRELPMGKVVFTNWSTAMDSAISYLTSPEVDSEFGSWEKLLTELDPYRDGMASMRIGSYLNSLIKGFEDGLSREQALENAANKFAIRWGDDKVIRR